MNFFTELFDTSDFPRRWDCGSWTPGLGWLHILSDLGVWSAYLAIPCILVYFVLRKKDIPFRAIFWLFGAFILACGTTHLMEAIIFWWPAYRLAGLIKLFTAIVSWATVIALVPLVPRALAMRSPEELEQEIAERMRAEEELRGSEQLFRQMAESIREMFWMQDGGWKQTLYVSPAYEAIWGRTSQSLYENPRSWIDTVHPDDREEVMVRLEQQLRGMSTDTEFRVARPDGTLRWVRCHAFPIKDHAGEVYRVAGLAEDITERKQAQEALRESEERFRGTFENAAVGIAHVDAEGRFLLVNEKLCDIVGYTREELLARAFRDVTHPEDLAASLEQFGALMRGEVPSFSLEKRYLRKDGSVVWGDVSLSIQSGGAGKPAYGIAILQDISELKKVEEELRRASKRLELAVRSSNVALGEWDLTAGPNGRVEWLNYWEQWGTGNPEDYPTANSMQSLLHPEDRDDVARLTEAYVSGEVKEFKSVHRVQHRDGSYHWALAQGVLFRDAQGRPIRSSGSVIDINDLKQAEENLRESEERFRGTFENAAVGIAHMDSQNRCLRANEKLSEILGYPSSELVGKTLQEVVHPDDLEPNLALFDPLVRGELPSFSMEKRFIRKDGASVWTQVTASVQRDAAAQPAFCIAMVQDISERKRLEAELSQAHDRLELAVRGSNVRIWDLDMPDGELQNGRMYSVNFWEHLGYGPETQAETATALSLLHPDDLEPAMRAVQAALSGETKVFEAEFRVRHKDGTYRWMLSRGAVVRNAAGRPVRFIGSDVDTTDLKRAEAALRESEQRFRTFVDHASDAFFLLDQRMVVLDVNRRACQSLGYTRDELVGMTPTHLDADITFADLEDIERRLSAGETVAFESRHRRKDGTVFPVEVRAQAFSEGGRHFTVALARDVTDRKRVEEALRLNEQRYRSLVEATSAIVWTLPASGLADKSEQPSWTAFTGQTMGQFTGWDWLDAIHPDDRPHTVQLWSAAVAARSFYQIEYRVRRRDGEYRNMLTRGVPIFAGDGEIREWFGTCIDITDLKRAEDALRESEERFRGTFENAAVGIAHNDVTGRFLRVNQKFCDIVGYTREELLTKTWQDITYPDDVAASLRQYSPLMRGESLSFSLEKRCLHKDHSLVWVDVSVSLQRDAAGSPTYAIAMVQDISERKRLEDELRQAKEGAEAANRSKDEFLANVSHEIRTPMNAILGMTDLALDTPLTDDQRQYLKTVQSAADSLLGVINDLLDFSKIEAGKLELDCADFSLRAVLGDTLRALALRAHKKGLELISHVQSGVPEALVGDAGRLRQSLLNLVGNAIKFTEEGEVVVRVEVASDSVPDGEVGLHFTVTDTGIGIPPEKQETIFRAFEQEDTSTTRKYGGTGLGLTIASRLVALMGGRITVDSQPGRGSTFGFTARFGRQPHQPEPVACPPVLLRNLRVLLVDDNVTNRRILEEWLRGWQMEPAAVGDGLAALNALWHATSLGRPYPLMLLDARMPDTDGLALAAKLREHNELSSTRIILLTSGDRPGDLARSRQLGINANLLKPVQQEELLEMIYQVMSRTNGNATEAARSAPSQEPTRGLGPNLKPLRILIAEDNEFNAQHLERLLVRGHHSVRLANNGRVALALLGIDDQTSGADSLTTPGPSPPTSPSELSSATSDFDLLLLDLHMPELDGFQVVQALREREQVTGRHLLVIALTARSRNEDRERCLAAGMDDFLSKPVRSVELFAAIERVLFDHRIPPPILPDTGDGTSLLDPVVLLGACGDDAEGLRAMGQGFEVYLPRRLAEVADALRNEDAPGLRVAAHKLCGLLSAFSTVAGGVASSLEDHAASGRLEECRPLVEQLEVMARELVQEMDGLSIESLRERVRAAGDTKSR